MVTQKMISVKLDIDQLKTLDDTCSKLGINRNKFINFLVSYGNSMLKDAKMLQLLSIYSRSLVAFD